jgi:DNA transformation protein
MPPPTDSMREWLEDCLQDLPEFAIRRMFGGAGLYAQGRMFGILHEARVYLQTDATNRDDYVARGSEAFRVRQGTVLTNYYEVPAAVMADDSELLGWARRALAVALAKYQKPKASRAKRPASRKRKPK